MTSRCLMGVTSAMETLNSGVLKVGCQDQYQQLIWEIVGLGWVGAISIVARSLIFQEKQDSTSLRPIQQGSRLALS